MQETTFWMILYFIQDAASQKRGEKNERVITHDVRTSNKAHMRVKKKEDGI